MDFKFTHEAAYESKSSIIRATGDSVDIEPTLMGDGDFGVPVWHGDFGDDGAVVYTDDGTVANIPIDLSAYQEHARLVAHAPELLASLEAIVDCLSSISYTGGEVWDNEVAAARAVIEKATLTTHQPVRHEEGK